MRAGLASITAGCWWSRSASPRRSPGASCTTASPYSYPSWSPTSAGRGARCPAPSPWPRCSRGSARRRSGVGSISGARPLLMPAGSIAATLLVFGWSQVRDLAQFYLLWILIGITMATVLYEPAFAVVTAWFERKRTRALTAVTLMAGFASTIFMPLESWLIELQGWRPALLILAAFLAPTR